MKVLHDRQPPLEAPITFTTEANQVNFSVENCLLWELPATAYYVLLEGNLVFFHCSNKIRTKRKLKVQLRIPLLEL